jgi:TolB-like protein
VRKSGNRVRVNVQLINATNDQHIWAQDYDRDLTDVFAIQTDLAQKITDALQAKLSPTEKAQMTRRPTENGEAYLAFVQAHNLAAQYEDVEKLKQAEQLYERAVRLDANFALALAGASQLQSWLYHTIDPTPARRDIARATAERALRLNAELPEAHLALGFSFYYGDQNFDAALREFKVAEQGLPNSPDVYLPIAAIQRRQGRWPESTANFEKAVSLDPNNTWPLQNLAFNYQMTRNYPAAFATLDRALKIDPSALGLLALKLEWAVAQGQTQIADDALAAVDVAAAKSERREHATLARINAAVSQRKWLEALQQASTLSNEAAAKVNGVPEALFWKYLIEGIARQRLQQDDEAQAALSKAKAFAERGVAEAPGEPKRHLMLAHALAYLGEKDAAIAEARRAVELRPESVDAFEGPVMTTGLAEVYAILGETDRAIELLEQLLSRPSDITVQSLERAPVWDTLRDAPRFRALLETNSAKA